MIDDFCISGHNVAVLLFFRSPRYCLFALESYFTLGSNIEASKSPRNDLKSRQRYRSEPYASASGPGVISP